jgi:hypothetical protein
VSNPVTEYPGGTDEARKFLNERLILFRAACTVYDKKTAKDILVELKEKNWPHPISEMLETLAGHLLHSEFEEAAGVARDYDDV